MDYFEILPLLDSTADLQQNSYYVSYHTLIHEVSKEVKCQFI